MEVKDMKERARSLRAEILNTIYLAKSGHPGGSLSALEVMMTLYMKHMKIDSKNPKWEGRDRFIMSKGHASPVLYSILSEVGFFSKSELKNFRQYKGMLQGHAYRGIPGVELSTGSLGMGLSVGVGIALASRLKRQNFNTYVLLGDGEIQEGSIWEAAMSGGHNSLSNLCAIVDFNKVQENGFVDDIKCLEPIGDKWRSFGWNVININGHSFDEIESALNIFMGEKEKPTVIIANTVKGKGVDFMEFDHHWHGKAPNKEQFQDAVANL